MDNRNVQKKESVSLPTNYDFKDGKIELNAIDSDSSLRLQAVKTYNFEKQINAFEYYLTTPVEVNKIRNVDKEFDLLVPEQSWLGGRSINPYSENNSAFKRMMDISESLVWNPNNANNTVINGLPKGGASTRY